MTQALKIILSILISLLLAGALVVGYLYFIAGGSLPNIVKDWFPENSTEEIDGEIMTIPDLGQTEGEIPLSENALIQISRNPVAGMGFRESVATTTVIYVERETGNFFSYDADSNEKMRLTNATLPRIQEAVFSTDGTRALLHYLSEDRNSVETFMTDIPEMPTTELGELGGSFLPRNISGATPEIGANFFYIVEDAEKVTGFVTTSKTDSQVWTSPMREWIPSKIAGGNFSLQTKASGAVPGYVYIFNRDSKVMRRVIGNTLGATALIRPDLKAAIYSESDGEWVRLSLIDMEDGTRTELGARTLPEKCVWKNLKRAEIICAVPNQVIPGLYPDQWYQGEASFSDSLWLVNTEDGTISLLANLKEEAGMDIDATNLTLDKKDELLIFKNKRDGSLWKLTLPQTVAE